jgi:hypothetical protein
MNFALYQANQKAYEATLLKNFLVHALHPERVAECFTAESEHYEDVAPYLRSVLQNVKSMADKMIWNAHCRAVNLLANDGKDGAPFLDVQQLSQNMFSDFCPDNPVLVVDRVNESWHRAFSKPAMVRMSTKQYQIGTNSSPLEEIDDIVDKVFNKAFVHDLPTGRATKPLNKRTGKGRGLPGAILREKPRDLSRGNWLAFPLAEVPRQTPSPPPTSLRRVHSVVDLEAPGSGEEPRIIQDLRDMQYASGHNHEHPQNVTGDRTAAGPHATRLEYLYERFGEQALDSERIGDLPNIGHDEPSDVHPSSEADDLSYDSASLGHDDMVAKVPSWHAMLVLDHKRRLTETWGDPPQTLQRVLPGIKQVIANAFAKGYRPTTDDFDDKIRIIEAREQRQVAAHPRAQPVPGRHDPDYGIHAPMSSEPSNLQQAGRLTAAKHKQRVYTPNKRQKTDQASPDTGKTSNSVKKQSKRGMGKKTTKKSRVQQPEITNPSEPHSSGSTTLETHQALPPGAYFEPQNPGEKPAWRCGIKHAMGYYYNSGTRKSCMGCFTNIKDCAKNKNMDFYLPDNTYFYQPAPDVSWTPSKDLNKQRRSKNMSHNTIAKIAFWNSVRSGSSADEARKAGEDAVEAALRPKPSKEPTPEPPKPTPEPEPDLGPHPSGSATMEHGQDIPECAYSDKKERYEEFAWRCDVNHALGRYYLAGDKRTCPGCGSNRHGAGKQKDMDFYMPFGAVVRQEAPELSKWAPHRPNKRKDGASKKTTLKHYTHNQACSKKYFEALEAGAEHAEAVKIAIDSLGAELDRRQAKALEAQEESQDEEEEPRSSGKKRKSKPDTMTSRRNSNARKRALDDDSDGDEDYEDNEQDEYNSRTICAVSLVPKKRTLGDDSDDEMESDSAPQESDMDVEQHVVISSSSDEETSESDSE